MVGKAISVLLVFIIGINAHAEQKDTIRLTINAIARNCAEESGMPVEQLQTAVQYKDINQIRACFFKCYLNHYGLISKQGGRDSVNVPMTLVFVKYYIPDISFLDLLVVGTEVMVCSEDLEKNTLPDDRPSCLKTKVLINCLAKRKMLMNAFWLATGS